MDTSVLYLYSQFIVKNRKTTEDTGTHVSSRPGKRKRKWPKRLPYSCVYGAWFLVFLTTATSAFFTFTYSLEWGKEKSNAWLTSMLLSVCNSVLIIQPTKVRANIAGGKWEFLGCHVNFHESLKSLLKVVAVYCSAVNQGKGHFHTKSLPHI